jgi:enediyne biosynthesis protein E4
MGPRDPLLPGAGVTAPEVATRAPWRQVAARLGLGIVLGASVTLGVVAVVDARAAVEPPPAFAAPRFVEELSDAGLDQVYDGDFHHFVGGGVAAFDCDDDGFPDLYLAGGSEPAGLYRNTSAVGGPLRFERRPDPTTDLTGVIGAYPLDLDGDGVTDLMVLRQGANVLLRGLGDCRFEPAGERVGLDGGQDWTTAFSATWEPDAELPSLAFGNYLDPDDRERGTCVPSLVVRPTGDAGHAEYGPPTPLRPAHCTLSLLFSDWDRSGRRDLRISNDRQYHLDAEEQLWRIAPGEAPRAYGREDGWQRLPLWGMGIASQDLTGDGHPEVFLTSQGDNKLQTLAEGPERPHYEDIAIDRGVTAHRPHLGGDVRPSTAWHPSFQDVNNDGYLDLHVTKGNVEAMPEFAAHDPSNLLLGQPDGTFVERSEEAGLVSLGRARGAAVVDLNLDGLLDVVEVNRREPVRVWRNVGWGTANRPQPTGNWVALRLRSPAPNRDAIGAWLEVVVAGRTTWHEVTIGGGHAGGQLGWHHLGLGDAEQARLRVRWPDGELSPWVELPANGFAVLERGEDDPVPWTPAS